MYALFGSYEMNTELEDRGRKKRRRRRRKMKSNVVETTLFRYLDNITMTK